MDNDATLAELGARVIAGAVAWHRADGADAASYVRELMGDGVAIGCDESDLQETLATLFDDTPRVVRHEGDAVEDIVILFLDGSRLYYDAEERRWFVVTGDLDA